jgi:hypothetical protein
MTDHRRISRGGQHTPAPQPSDVESALDLLNASPASSLIDIPDAALSMMVATICGALQCEELPRDRKDLLWTCWHRLCNRLEELIPGAVEHLACDHPDQVDAELARAIVLDEWPDEGEALLCWSTTEHDRAEDHQ